MSGTYTLTKEGHEKLKEEYQYLIEVEHPKTIERVKKAREMGSLDDNPEYDAARQEQGLIEKRILELDEILKNTQVIEKPATNGKIDIGSKVTIEIDDEEDTYLIVGSAEADPEQDKISNESPVGKTLLGHKVGDEVEVETPHARLIYKIKEIQ